MCNTTGSKGLRFSNYQQHSGGLLNIPRNMLWAFAYASFVCSFFLPWIYCLVPISNFRRDQSFWKWFMLQRQCPEPRLFLFKPCHGDPFEQTLTLLEQTWEPALYFSSEFVSRVSFEGEISQRVCDRKAETALLAGTEPWVGTRAYFRNSQRIRSWESPQIWVRHRGLDNATVSLVL